MTRTRSEDDDDESKTDGVERDGGGGGTRRPPARPLDRVAVLSLLTFGGTIGLITALSRAQGTAITLLGLVFALVGGSVVALYKGTDFTDAQRRGIFRAAGLTSAGILLGLFSGFGLRALELYVFKPNRPLLSPDTPPSSSSNSSDGGGDDIFVVQAGDPTRLGAFRTALNQQINAPDLPQAEKDELLKLQRQVGSPSFRAAVADVANLTQRSPSLKKYFKQEFEDTFGKPAPDQPGNP